MAEAYYEKNQEVDVTSTFAQIAAFTETIEPTNTADAQFNFHPRVSIYRPDSDCPFGCECPLHDSADQSSNRDTPVQKSFILDIGNTIPSFATPAKEQEIPSSHPL